jgi:short subunit dehydrogenase-like uncharacterized protein
MITLLAATGFTGQLVARELHRLSLPLRLAARSQERLRELAAQVGDPPMVAADVTQPESLRAAFDGARVLINCAGPFTELGEPVVAEAARRGIHYLDTTGEQEFIKLVFDRYGREARERGAALVPAAAFEYALADAAAALAAEGLEPCDEVTIIYAIAGFGASRGTKKSVLHALGNRGHLYRDGALIAARAGAEQREVRLPDGRLLFGISFPGGEAIQVPAHVRTQAVTTLMAANPLASAVLPLGAVLLPAMLKSPLGGWLRRRIEGGAFGPTAEQRAATRFTIHCEARRDSARRAVMARGADPYGLTAVVIAALAKSLHEREPLTMGAISPTMVAGPELIVAATEAAGVRWTKTQGEEGARMR